MKRLETSLNGLDIVSSITQTTINDHFAALKRAKVIPDDLVLDLPRRLGTLKAKLLAPSVTLGLDDDRTKVLFELKFASGLFSTFDDNNQPKEVAFGASSIAVRVDIDLSHVDAAQVPESVQNAIKNLGAGMFSIRQLLFDFQNAALASYDPKHTTLPRELLDDALFIAGLITLFQNLHKTGANLLGYAVTVTNPNEACPEAPTFPPTDLNFATQLYLDDVSETRKPDLDSLNYLLMTQHRPFPPRALPTGNLVQEGSHGTMAISRAVFVEGYLLPLLSKITNRTSTFTDIGWYYCSLKTEAGGSFEPAWEEKRTLEDLVSPFKDNIEQDTYSYPAATGAQVMPAFTGHRWHFVSVDQKRIDQKDTPVRDSTTVLRGLASHACELSITPGTNEIKLRGVSLLGTSWNVWAGVVDFFLTAHELHTLSARIDWEATLRLVVDSSGHVGAQIEYEAKPIRIKQGSNWVGAIGNFAWPEQAKNNLEDLQKEFTKTFDSDELKKAIAGAFSTQRSFVFPGGQQYFFKDLVFNNELDLLATLTIKFY
jgi:hypothetical protein